MGSCWGLEVLDLHLIFFYSPAFPAYARVLAGTVLSKKLVWDVQVHAMTYKAEPDEEI